MAGASDAAGGALGALTGPLTEFVGGIKEITDSLRTFVEALNPAAVVQMDQAFRNVLATIGQALLPAVQIFTEALQSVAAVLDEPLRALAPVVEHLAGIIRGVLIADAQQLGAVLTILGNTIEALSPLLEALSEPVKLSAAALSALAVGSKGVFEGLRPVVESIANAFKQAIIGVTVFTSYLLKAVGATDALNNFAAALRQQGEPGRVQNAAPLSVGISSLEEITRTLSKSAGLAGAGEKAAPTTDQFIADIAKAVGDVANNGKTFQTWLGEQWEVIAEKIKVKLAELKNQGVNFVREAGQAAGNRTRQFQDDNPVADFLTGGPGRRLIGLPF
jgi:hypothetical protein